MQRIYKDLKGRKFNKLTIIKEGISKRGKQGWECLCDCGNTVILETSTVMTGNNLSCGKCLKRIYEDLTGKSFKSWRVVSKIPNIGPAKWLCECVCGKRKIIWASNLLSSKAIGNCGCLSRATRTFEQEQRNVLRKLRKTIVIRDLYACKLCGNKPLQFKLKVHHIFPFKLYPELRLDPKNLITLCSKCHVLAHNGNFNCINKHIQQELIQIANVGDYLMANKIKITDEVGD